MRKKFCLKPGLHDNEIGNEVLLVRYIDPLRVLSACHLPSSPAFLPPLNFLAWARARHFSIVTSPALKSVAKKNYGLMSGNPIDEGSGALEVEEN
jgi:hypothetical protein